MKAKKMMTIQPNIKLSELQNEFTSTFPFLKLEFFKKPHGIHGASPKKDLIKTDMILKLKKKGSEKSIIISEDMPVSTVEQLFNEYFGLSAQVFRKSGKSWLETSMTDDWTLKRQNDEGCELSYFA